MNRRLLLASGIGLAAAAAGAGFALLRPRRGVGEAEAAFWALSFEQPDGSTLTMAKLRGAPLLLNFWATWCPPCIKEMPLLDRFHRENRARGWQVVGLAVDGPSPVREYLARLPMGFPIGLAGMGGAELSRSLGNVNAALPFTVVFGADGTIQARKLGTVSSSDLESWVRWA
jgi:thiol-disulfide isomerase/thioredoxin